MMTEEEKPGQRWRGSENRKQKAVGRRAGRVDHVAEKKKKRRCKVVRKALLKGQAGQAGGWEAPRSGGKAARGREMQPLQRVTDGIPPSKTVVEHRVTTARIGDEVERTRHLGRVVLRPETAGPRSSRPALLRTATPSPPTGRDKVGRRRGRGEETGRGNEPLERPDGAGRTSGAEEAARPALFEGQSSTGVGERGQATAIRAAVDENERRLSLLQRARAGKGRSRREPPSWSRR